MERLKKIGLAAVLAVGAAFGGTGEAAAMETERQLDLLSAQEVIWKQQMSIEEAVAQGGQLAVTDLDRNGRLELIFTTTAGEEGCIETWGYEVNEEGDGVSLLTALDETNGAAVGHFTLPMYLEPQTGVRYYILETGRWVDSPEDVWEREVRRSGLWLEHGSLRQEVLGSVLEEYEDRSSPPIGTTFRDRDGNEIDEEEYVGLEDIRYHDCLRREVTIGWTRVRELGRAMDSREKVRAVFAGSWERFREDEAEEQPNS